MFYLFFFPLVAVGFTPFSVGRRWSPFFRFSFLVIQPTNQTNKLTNETNEMTNGFFFNTSSLFLLEKSHQPDSL